jgi:hypothetical protein
MTTQTKFVLGLASLVTLASIMTWQLTGGDYYTKFEVIEQVEAQVDANDPLAGTGFYDGQRKQTVARKEFRLGLLPTPNGIFDKHMFAVVTIVSPVWVIAIGLWWRQRQKTLSKRRMIGDGHDDGH